MNKLISEMFEHNDTMRILNAESQVQMTKARDTELAKVLKLRLVLRELQQLPLDSLHLPNGVESVERTLKLLTVCDYLKLENPNDTLLNLRECHSVDLSYIERKVLHESFMKHLQESLNPIAELSQKLRGDFPELFAVNTQKPSIDLSPDCEKIICLDQQRRTNLEALVNMRNRKCSLLKKAAELKFGPHLEGKLELLHAQACLDQLKASVLRNYFVNQLANRTDKSFTAIKMVEGYIDEALKQREDKQKSQK